MDIYVNAKPIKRGQMTDAILTLINIFVPLISVAIALGSFFLSKAKIAKFESNCIATLTARVNDIDEDIKEMKGNIEKIFTKTSDVGERISRIEGKLNGSK